MDSYTALGLITVLSVFLIGIFIGRITMKSQLLKYYFKYPERLKQDYYDNNVE